MTEYFGYFEFFAKCAWLWIIIPVLLLGCSETRAVDDANTKTQIPAIKTVQNDEKIDSILSRLDKTSREIKTYEVKIIYLFKQPVLESESLRTGTLYYIDNGKISKLRINFSRLKQDNESVLDYEEDYLFDGINLTRADYRTKNVEYRQLTDSNKPMNAFELANRYLPIIGFAQTDKLRGDFDVSLSKSDSDSANLDELLLRPKPDTRYSSDYIQIRFWVDKQSSIPVRIEAISPQEDIYDIRLNDSKVNKELPSNIFEIKVPANFTKNVVPFKNEQ